MATRGISVIDLLGLPPGSTSLIPADMRAELEKLSVSDFNVITSAAAFIYTGTIRSFGEAFFASSLNWPIELPLLNAGVPFQLVRRRLPLVGDIEPAPDEFQLDLLLNRVAIVIPGLQPATAIPGVDVTPAHLIRPIAGQPLFGKRVKIVGSGTLRIASAPGGGAPVIRFVAPPDPFDPDAPTGALVGLTFEPASFFLGSSDYGLTVDRLLYDDSEAFTPADIEARGQGPEWRGISIREATLYFPRNAPAVGDLSVGVRDVLLGSPLGLQGEVRVEFGTTPVNPATISVTQHMVGDPPHDVALGSPVATAAARSYQVQLSGLAGTRATISAHGPDGSTNRWTLPDGTIIVDSTSGQFAVEAGDTLRVAGIEGGAGDLAVSPEVTILFVPQATTSLPAITIISGGHLRSGVVSMSGTQEILSGYAYTLDPATDAAFEWQFGTGVTAQTGRGASFTPTIPATPGTYFLSVGKPDGLSQRVRIEVLAEGALLIGTRAGLFDISAPVNVRAVEATYRLASFNARGDFDPAPDNATLAAGVVAVPDGDLASVTADWDSAGGSAAPPPPPDVPRTVARHVQVMMVIDDTTPTQWVPDPDNLYPSDPDLRPRTITTDAEAIDRLAAWQADWNGASFIVVGRTCDIGTPGRNATLSALRGVAGKRLLGATTAFQRGERFKWGEPGTDAGGATEAASTIPIDERAQVGTDPLTGPDYDGWLFKIDHGGGFPGDSSTDTHDRPAYRRVDIYAVGGTPVADPAAPPDTASQAATGLRRGLIPGSVPPLPVPLAPRDVATPYRVRLVVRWDSPTVTELSDAIPTQAELTIAWQGRSIPVPGGAGNVTPTATSPQVTDGHEVFTLVGGWTYDPRTTATQFSLALNSTGDPDGLAKLSADDPNSGAMAAVATAFALGPALLAGIGAADVAGGVTRVAALVAAIGFAAVYGKDGAVVFHGVKVEWRQRAIDTAEGARFRLLCDYTAAIGFEFDQFGITIAATKPLKVRYRDVGIEIDSAKSGFDAFGVLYDNASFDIEDPGQWVINGPLGELIRVAGTRAGSGSTWVELDLKFALDLGVVKITGCILRASFTNGGLNIEFRGFSASIDLPGVVSGSGSVSIGDGGLIRAGLAATIVPINTSATASLALQGDFVALEVGVILPVGIPLASSGLAIYGFVGRVVSNGKRNMAGLPADPVGRELGWYERDGAQKYSPAPGQWAMGLGISIGTMPDTGFTFNALGMISVGFPDPDVVISIDAKLFDRPSLPDERKAASPAGSLRILGIISISPNAVIVGVRGSYEIPKVLKLQLPFGAYFPIRPGNTDPSFVRIGADGINGRIGDPVSLTLLPGTLDIGVWAYAMVEERNLLRLGDVEGFDLNGFSIGFGAGWTMKWGGGPIYLKVSAKILAGLGTKPLTIVAGLFIEGELRLIIVSVSVRGDVRALITADVQSFSGTFCGKVDFFFFSVEGCVHVEFGSGTDPGIPVPDHPLTRIDLTGRTGAITGRAYRAGEALDPARPGLAWPDTVPLLNFAAYVQNRLSGSAFAPVPAELPGEPWSGSTDLKYAYRLTSLVIRKAGGGAIAGPLDSVWWWPTHRGGVLDPADPPPSAQEGRQLALLSWHPTPWSRNLADGGKDTPANPGGTVGNLCTPVKDRFRSCVRGDLLVRENPDAVRLSGPAGTRFAAIVSESFPGATSMADAAAAVSLAGWTLMAGHARAFAPPIDVPAGPVAVTAGYRLASVTHGNALIATLAARIEPTLALDDAVLTLELCVGGRAPAPGNCDDFSDLEIGARVDGSLRRPGVTWQWSSDAWRQASPIVDNFAPVKDGKPELWVGSKGIAGKLDTPTDRIELTVAHAAGEPVMAIAFDAAGAIVARAQATPTRRTPQLLVLAGPGIVAVQVAGGGNGNGISAESGGSLLKFCTGHGGSDIETALRKLIGKTGSTALPTVEAVLADGTVVPLEPKVVGTGNIDTVAGALARSASVRRCALVQYRVPAGQTATQLQIAAWSGGNVSIVALCGTDWITRYIQTVNGDAQSGTAGSLGDHADPSTSERPNLLDADTAYEIVVGMEWTGWRKPRTAPANAGPPPINGALAWTSFGEVVHKFRTAPAAVLPANPPPADFADERVFDPRGLMRYFLGFRPDGLGAPHFLDDPIKVDFRADHIAPLLAQYGRSLALKLRRTDPPPASLAGPGGLGGSLPPPLVPMTVTVALLDRFLLEASDRLLVEAAEAAPCLDAPAVGGRTLDITAPLEPDADYDLLLVAPPVATPASDAVLITRGHFHTSRYAGPAALLAAMALPTTGDPDPRLPTDALVLPGLPAVVAAANDAGFETVLRALGLDPWPLPTLPRVVALWSKVAPFRLHGIMLETDEALERPGRMAVTAITVAGTALQRIAANTATTRMIWMAATPIVVPDDSVVAVSVSDRGTLRTGRRSILRLPRMAFLEGLA